MTLGAIWLDAGSDVVEKSAQVGTEQSDRDDDDDGDQRNHEAVLNGRGAPVVPKAGDLETKLEQVSEHFRPLLRTELTLKVEDADRKFVFQCGRHDGKAPRRPPMKSLNKIHDGELNSD